MKPAHLLDTSALLAHLLKEPGEDIVEHCLSAGGGRSAVSIVSWVEFQLIISRSSYQKVDAQKIIGLYRDAMGVPPPIAACAKSHGSKLVYRDKPIESIPEKAPPPVQAAAEGVESRRARE